MGAQILECDNKKEDDREKQKNGNGGCRVEFELMKWTEQAPAVL